MDSSDFKSALTGENTPDKAAERDREDHDSPWKEALEVFFRPFMEFLYPDIALLIDWQQAAVFMDKELQKITSAAESSRSGLL